MLGITADIISQLFIEKAENPKSFLFRSIGVMGTYGFIETAVEAKLLYQGLDRLFGSHQTVLSSIVKVFFDIFVYTSIESGVFIA